MAYNASLLPKAIEKQLITTVGQLGTNPYETLMDFGRVFAKTPCLQTLYRRFNI